MTAYPAMVSIVLPIFNEADSLEELYLRTRAVLDPLGIRFEFIAVNDGSTDDTDERLATLRLNFSNIGIISHRRNHGKSMALMQGFALAQGDVAVTMDADLQDEPENIPPLLEKLAEGFDLVNGWRSSRSDSAGKVLVSGIYNLITRRLLKVQLHDINCGMKVLRKPLYKRLHLRGDLHRLIPAMAQSLGFRVGELPVAHAPRKHGSSKYRLLRHRGLLDIISLSSTLAYRVRPFHVFTEIALVSWAFFAVSFGAMIAVLLRFHDSPWGLYLASPLLLAASLTFLLIGIMFPVIGLILDNILTHFNDEAWRGGLIKEVVPPEN